jgi:pyruvate ferredoxin oxidoreductase beta subunit
MTLGLRHALDVFGEDTVMPIPSSCALAVTRSEPYTTPLGVPIIPTNMPSPGGVMTGVRRAMKQRGKDEMHVLGFCGDGSSGDIGFSSLSGAAQRGESVVWLTYDNDGYMNTGVQWSSSTPAGAVTTTTPEGSKQASEDGISKKSVPLMMALHDGVAYVATASVAFVDDLRQKLETAKDVTERDEGMAYVQLQAPCPPGWRFPEDETVDVARTAVRSGAWPLFEVRNGELTLNHKPSSREPVGDFLARQGRFSHLSEEQIEQIATDIDRNWERLVGLDEAEAELFQ